MREVQRNYKKIFEKARRSRTPIFLGVRGKPHVVVIGVKEFESMQGHAQNEQHETKWQEIFRELEYLKDQGAQDVNLAEFIIRDRNHH